MSAKTKPERLDRSKAPRYSSMAEVVRDLSEDPKFAGDLIRNIHRKKTINHLTALRCKQDLSQADMAERLGCTQSRVSKLENSYDDETSVGDLQAYAAALGFEVSLIVNRPGSTLANMVKYHIVAVRRILRKLAELSAGDEAMVNGLKVFLNEVLFNTKITVDEINEQFDRIGKTMPNTIEPEIDGEDDTPEPAQTKPKKKPAKRLRSKAHA